MVRSLRWRLQIWHAAVLAAVIVSFGGIVYALQWETRLQQIDANLDRTATVLNSRLRGLMPLRWGGRGSVIVVQKKDGSGWEWGSSPAPRDLPNEFPPPDLPPAELVALTEKSADHSSESDSHGEHPLGEHLGADSAAVAELPSSVRERRGERERFDRARWPLPPRRPNAAPPGLELPDEFEALLKQTRQYFIIWDRDGEVKDRSGSAPEIAWPEGPEFRVKEDNLPVRHVRTRDGMREVINIVPRLEWTILIGQPLDQDEAAHHATAFKLGLAGFGVLAVGLLGGWWSAARATRPIQMMTRTASAISARNLSQRIDVAGTDNELGQLASVLNGAFDRLEAAFKKQTRFTADASHELRTPISVILANADFALSRARSEEEYREALESVRRASHRMRSLIESLLTLARFDSGKTPLASGPVDLPLLVQETTSLVEPLAKQRDIVISSTTSPVAVTGDRDQLSQVLVNLLTNAIRYNREGGTVRVAVSKHLKEAVISVSDDGIGIPAEHLPHIFDRFYRVDPARSRSDGGSGLGLSICRTIVEAHGGAITARSEPGAGTTLEVRLPYATTPQAEAVVTRA